MKLSVAVASKEAPPSAFVVWRGFEESISKAADYGYHGVELALKSADEIEPDKLNGWLTKHDIEVSCISTGQVFAILGLYFTHPEASMRKKVIDLFGGLIDLAKDFGQLVNVGRTRGFIAENQSRQEAEQLFIDTSRQICDMAGENGVTIIIEPVNRYEINFVNNLDEGAELLAKVERDNLGLMPDVFHMNIEDVQIGGSLVKHANLVKYIHFADSNRWAPGWGHLDFNDVFAGLRQAEFDGWSAIEILPHPDPDSAAKKAAETILPMIELYNQRADSFLTG
jgi:sugar phosphate isomerase/epimerase